MISGLMKVLIQLSLLSQLNGLTFPYDKQNQWASTCIASTSKEQSPVNIDQNNVIIDMQQRMTLMPINLQQTTILSDQLQLPGTFMQMFSIDLAQRFRGYVSTHLEFHHKSEHTFSNIHYSAELQVHFQETQRSASFNVANPRNKAVVSFLLTSDPVQVDPLVSNQIDFPLLQFLATDQVGVVQKASFQLPYALAMKQLLAQNKLEMYEYNGSGNSVTNCNQDITYFVYKPLFYISTSTLQKYQTYMLQNQQLFSTAGTNNRNVHPTYGRKIYNGRVIANLNRAYIHTFTYSLLLVILLALIF